MFLVKFFATRRGGLDVILSAIGVVAIAFTTYALEDLINGDEFGWLAPKLALGLGLVGWLFLHVRGRIAYRRGTLLYLRLLFEFMADLHDISLETRLRGHAEHKIVARWINSDGIVGVVHDLVPEVSAIALEAERSLNEDTSDTGTAIAPNMIWSSAMAVGYDVAELNSEQIELVEFLPGERGNTDATEVRKRAATESVEWRIRARVRDSMKFATPTVVWTEGVSGREAKLVLIQVELTGEGRPSPPQWSPDILGRVAVYGDADPAAALAKVCAERSANTATGRTDALLGLMTKPVEIDTRSRRRVRNRAIDAHRQRLQQRTKDDGGFDLPSLLDFEEGLTIVRPQIAAEVCLSAIRGALHEYPQARIMLVLRVPKTVGLALGNLLAVNGKGRGNPGCGHPGCRNVSCASPWGSLLPLNWVGGGRPYQVLRVHRSQPSASEMDADFGAEVKGVP